MCLNNALSRKFRCTMCTWICLRERGWEVKLFAVWNDSYYVLVSIFSAESLHFFHLHNLLHQVQSCCIPASCHNTSFFKITFNSISAVKFSPVIWVCKWMLIPQQNSHIALSRNKYLVTSHSTRWHAKGDNSVIITKHWTMWLIYNLLRHKKLWCEISTFLLLVVPVKH